MGNEFAPNPVPVQAQAQSPYPQLMGTTWNGNWEPWFPGQICALEQVTKDNEDREDWKVPVKVKKVGESQKARKRREQDEKKEKIGGAKYFKVEFTDEDEDEVQCQPCESNDLQCLTGDMKDDGVLNPVGSGEWENVSFMVDSGASETVANSAMFQGFETYETSATGTEYSSAAKGGDKITNEGEKRIEVMDENGTMKFMRVQMCDNLNPKKFLASVSRMTQAGHRVVFDSPDQGSYVEDKKTGVKTWMRQESGVYYIDLWVSPTSTFGRQGAQI